MILTFYLLPLPYKAFFDEVNNINNDIAKAGMVDLNIYTSQISDGEELTESNKTQNINCSNIVKDLKNYNIDKKYLENLNDINYLWENGNILIVLIFLIIIRSNQYNISEFYIVKGQINNPGFYLVDKTTDISALVREKSLNSEKYIISPNNRVVDVFSEEVELNGAFRFPSYVSLKNIEKLSDIISDPLQLSFDAYLHFGYVKKRDSENGTASFVTFAPQTVFLKGQDVLLSNGDQIRIFRYKEISVFQKYLTKYSNYLGKYNI